MDTDIIIVLTVLTLTAALLIIDILRIDLVALICLLLLGWTGILEPHETISGFASNAVIVMVSVMIMGKGIARTGLMSGFARLVIKVAGDKSPRITAVMSAATGLLSGFIQNIGAAALFLPAILSVARRKKIAASRLIMPIGFAIILSGTLTMIGSGPLMLVNDFLGRAELKPFSLFADTPVGLTLLSICIVYFLVLGRHLLPKNEGGDKHDLMQKKMVEGWNLSDNIRHYRISAGSALAGKTLEEAGLWGKYHLNILAIAGEKGLEYAPWRETRFEDNQTIALMGNEQDMRDFAAANGLIPAARLGKLDALDDAASAGFAEIIVPPRSAMIGQTMKQYGLRRHYGVEPVLLFHKGERVPGDFSNIEINAGDIFLVHGLWDKIAEMKKGNDLAPITNIEAEEKDTSKAWLALGCFVLAIVMTLFGFPIAVSFLSGAVAMVLAGVIRIDDAYRAVDWKVVVFLGGLIPLGLAMQKTGAAAFLAEKVFLLVEGSHLYLILLVISALTTLFSLFISNVGAAVVFYPVAINIAQSTGIDPRPLVLMIAVSTANSFMLPTHQVNAFLKSPGGYRNKDYMKAGSGLTIISWLTVVSIFYLFYL